MNQNKNKKLSVRKLLVSRFFVLLIIVLILSFANTSYAFSFNISDLINGYKNYVAPVVVQKKTEISTTPNVIKVISSNSGITQANLNAEILKLLNSPDIQVKFKGAKGDSGINGVTTTVFSSAPSSPNPVGYLPVGVTIPNATYNFSGGAYENIANLSSNIFTTNTANVADITVSGSSTLKGDLSVGGNTSLTGNLDVKGIINPNFTIGSIPFQTGAGLAQDNSNLFYDPTNHYLGIGTSNPSNNLTVSGNSNFYANSINDAVFIAQNHSGSNALFILGYGGTGSALDVKGLAHFGDSSSVNALDVDSLYGVTISNSTVYSRAHVSGGSLVVQNNIGIGTTSPSYALDVNGDSSISGVLKLLQSGTNAVILGDISGNARGANSVDLQSSRSDATQVASASYSTAVGQLNKNTALYSSTFGYNNLSSGLYAVSVGYQNTASGSYGVGIGYQNNASAGYALGFSNTATGTYSVAIGATNSATGTYGSTLGYGNNSNSAYSTAVGYSNSATNNYALALGYSNTASASGATAIGQNITNNLTNSLMIGPSDSAKLTILSNGNVGIGTTAPATALSVAGSGTFTGALNVGNNGLGVSGLINFNSAYGIENLGLDSGGNFTLNNQTGSVGLFYITPAGRFGIGNYYAPTNVPKNSLSVAGGASIGLGITSDVAAPTNGLLVAGNVGIGTTSPQSKLNVTGTANAGQDFGGQLTLNDNTTPTKLLSLGYDANLDYAFIQSLNSGLAYKNLTLNARGGNVGIGTTIPGAKLDVFGEINSRNTGASTLRLYSDASGGYIGIAAGSTYLINNAGFSPTSNNSYALGDSSHYWSNIYTHNIAFGAGDAVGYTTNLITFFNASDGGMYLASDYNGAQAGGINFQIAGAGTKVRIDKSGNVGIGTTSPQSKLDVAGKILAAESTGTVSGGFTFELDGGNDTGMFSPSDGIIDFYNNNVQEVRIGSSGLVRLFAYGSGNLISDANGNITASSDEKLKDVQGNFTDGLTAIMGLNPIIYKWNTLSGLDQVNTYAGFSAQNVQKFIPEAVGVDPRGYLTLSDRPIEAALVNAVKEMNFKIDNVSNQLLQNIVSDKVTTKELCIEDVCVNKDQLKALLQNSQNNNNVLPPASSPPLEGGVPAGGGGNVGVGDTQPAIGTTDPAIGTTSPDIGSTEPGIGTTDQIAPNP